MYLPAAANSILASQGAATVNTAALPPSSASRPMLRSIAEEGTTAANRLDLERNQFRRQQWLMRMRQSRTDSPCVIAMVGCSGVLLIIIVVSSALIDLFASDQAIISPAPTFNDSQLPQLPPLLLSNNTTTVLQSICVAILPSDFNGDPAQCNIGISSPLENFQSTLALSDVGSLGPGVTRHLRNMMASDDQTQAQIAIRLKKVACAHVTPTGHDQQAFCAISLHIAHSTSEENGTSPYSLAQNRFIYTTLLDLRSLQPIESSGRLLVLPELAGSTVYPAHPTVFALGSDVFISLLAIDAATDQVNGAYLWDVLRNQRVDIRVPAFIAKNWRAVAPSWLPWVVAGRRLYFVFSIQPWQALSCAFTKPPITPSDSPVRRQLLCRVDSVTAPVLPRPFSVAEGGEELRVRDASLFLLFRDDYYLGYVQLTSNLTGQTSGHVMLVNALRGAVVALSSAITPSTQQQVVDNGTSVHKPGISISRSSASSASSNSFLLFGGMSGRRGVTIRIDGIGDSINAAIERDRAFERTCYNLNQAKHIRPFERGGALSNKCLLNTERTP